MKNISIRTRQRGKKWYYCFDIGKKEGKRKKIERGGFATQAEAEEAGLEAFTAWRHGDIPVPSEKLKMKDYLVSWLERAARVSVKRSTYDAYYSAVHSRIIPYLGDICLQELRPRDVDKWLRELIRKGYAQKTIRATKAVLSLALNYAVFPAELIRNNPARDLRVPRGAKLAKVKRTVITPSLLAQLFEMFPIGHRFRIPIRLLYYTGMRIGEVLGLEWQDIDFKAGRLQVRRQLKKSDKKFFYFDTPKTPTSERSFYLDAGTLSELKRWKACQAADKIRMGECYTVIYAASDGAITMCPQGDAAPRGMGRHELVCTNQFGCFLKYISLEVRLRKLGLNTHSFRHSHATHLIEGGVRPVDVAARLGHSDANMVNAIYAHDTEEMQRACVSVLEAQEKAAKM